MATLMHEFADTHKWADNKTCKRCIKKYDAQLKLSRVWLVIYSYCAFICDEFLIFPGGNEKKHSQVFLYKIPINTINYCASVKQQTLLKMNTFTT